MQWDILPIGVNKQKGQNEMKRSYKIASVLGLGVLSVAGIALADFPGELKEYFALHGQPAIGVTGTPLRLVRELTLTFTNASSTSETVTISGLVSTDSIIGPTAQNKPTNASYITSIVPGTDSAVIWYNTDPGTTMTIKALLVRD